jgi:hypothetical protein
MAGDKERIEGPPAGGAKAARRPPDLLQGEDKVAPSPAPAKLGRAVKGAQPHPDPVGEVKLGPPP